ncbi:hypothetical protein N7E02_03440 (plasmid) [Aliirhizobium terrae]|nr:hypothetical protein [Rhizobium sp. CC-CFT758]WJH37844.1 hypothetical protein N7E02_03440 [Rhizobium sp. CC-CFT758]
MAALILAATLVLPFVVVKPNRILQGQGRLLYDPFPPGPGSG